MTAKPKAPPGAAAGGRRLWSSIVDDFDLDEHELTLLRESVRTVDLLDRLEAEVQADGAMVDSPQGRKANQAALEARQQRIALARLLAALRLPAGEVGDTQATARPQRRVGVRRPYGITGAVG